MAPVRYEDPFGIDFRNGFGGELSFGGDDFYGAFQLSGHAFSQSAIPWTIR